MQKDLFENPSDKIYLPKLAATEAVKTLRQGSRIIGLTMGQFSLIDLIHETLKMVGGGDVIVSTWSAGIKDAGTVAWMCSTNLIKRFLLITDHSYVTRQKKYALQITDLFGPENIRTSNIHAKFVLISNENWKISIRTSMNLNANKTCETFEIEEGKDTFDFYHNFAMSIAGNMPNGFTADSRIVDAALKKAFNSQIDPYGWQKNE